MIAPREWVRCTGQADVWVYRDWGVVYAYVHKYDDDYVWSCRTRRGLCGSYDIATKLAEDALRVVEAQANQPTGAP